MGKIKDGILGGFSGKVGPVIGYQQGGQNLMRSLPDRRRRRKGNNPQTDAMKLVSSFVRPFKALLKVTVPSLKPTMSYQNFMVQKVFEFALSGKYPDLFIDYRRVQLSEGLLATVNNARVAIVGSELQFTWTPNAVEGSLRATDKAVIVVYSVQLRRVYHIVSGSTRNDGQAVMDLGTKPGGELHAWLVFRAATGKDTSPTVYCGELTLPVVE